MKTIYISLALAALNAPSAFNGSVPNAIAFGFILGFTLCQLRDLKRRQN